MSKEHSAVEGWSVNQSAWYKFGVLDVKRALHNQKLTYEQANYILNGVADELRTEQNSREILTDLPDES